MGTFFFRDIRDLFRAVPTPAAGLALSIASLGWSLENVLPLNGAVQSAGALAALVPLFCVACKFLFNPGLAREELRHPAIGSVMPTFSMALMVISVAAGVHFPNFSIALWAGAVCLHAALFLGFGYYQASSALRAGSARTLSLKEKTGRTATALLSVMGPSWFVPPVGIAMAALTVPYAQQPWLGVVASVALYFGLGTFALLLPLMLYRLIFHRKMADSAKPSIAILAAPPSLCLASYISFETDPSLLLSCLFMGIALAMTAVVYLTLPRLFRLPFSPAYAAMTFPLVISATALFKVSGLLAGTPVTEAHAATVRYLAVAELAVATLVVGLVAVLYAGSFLRRGGNEKALPEAVGPAD